MPESKFGALLDRLLAAGRPQPWVITICLVLTCVVLLVHIYIQYSHGSLVGTLAIVEDTSGTPVNESANVVSDAVAEVLPPYRDDPNADMDEDPAYTEEEQLLMATKPVKPITSSIRGTLAHLERGASSRLARVRAIGIMWIYGFVCAGLGTSVGNLFGHNEIAVNLGTVLAQVAFSWMNMLWTHMAISMPRNVWFWRRQVLGKKARHLMLPTSVWALAHTLVYFGVGFLAFIILPTAEAMAEHNGHLLGVPPFVLVARLCILLFLATILVFVFYLPATVVLVRCQAAMLPEGETPIIPFDRSFGGRANPTGRLSMCDAWNSFSWEARVRVAMVYLKTTGILLLCWGAYIVGLVGLLLVHLRTKKEGEPML